MHLEMTNFFDIVNGSNYTLMYSKMILEILTIFKSWEPIIPYFTINEYSNFALVYALV